MVDFKADERLNTLNHSCAHVMAQAVKHLYPQAKFWVGPVVKEGFYYDIDLGDDIINDEAIAAIEKEMKKVCKEGKKIYRREISKAEAMEMFKDDPYKLDLIEGLEDGNISVYDQGDFTDLCRGPPLLIFRTVFPLDHTPVGTFPASEVHLHQSIQRNTGRMQRFRSDTCRLCRPKLR